MFDIRQVIFSANALENIRYGKPSATDEEVISAAKAAQEIGRASCRERVLMPV